MEKSEFSDLLLTSQLTTIFKESNFSDVRFCVGKDGVEVPAHKLILSIRSKVFAGMFYENPVKCHSVVCLPDVDSDVFRKMLKFVYSDHIELKTCEEARDIGDIAKKYEITLLVKKCQEYLENQLILPEKACQYFEIATSSKLQLHYVENMCKEVFMRETKGLFQTAQFLQAQLSTVQAILKNDMLTIDSEMDVIQAVLAWGKAQCHHTGLSPTDSNVRYCIYPLLKYIRFLTIPLSDLQFFFKENSILNSVEVCAIISLILKADFRIEMPKTLCTITESRALCLPVKEENEEFYDCDEALNTETETLNNSNSSCLPGKAKFCNSSFHIQNENSSPNADIPKFVNHNSEQSAKCKSEFPQLNPLPLLIDIDCADIKSKFSDPMPFDMSTMAKVRDDSNCDLKTSRVSLLQSIYRKILGPKIASVELNENKNNNTSNCSSYDIGHTTYIHNWKSKFNFQDCHQIAKNE